MDYPFRTDQCDTGVPKFFAEEDAGIPQSDDGSVQSLYSSPDGECIARKCRALRGRSQHLTEMCESMSSCPSAIPDDQIIGSPRFQTSKSEPASLVETLPAELLQNIASYVHSDADLCSFIEASPSLAIALSPNKSGVWRNRFLAEYDYPFVTNSREEFAVAYKLRHFVFRNFVGFGGPEDERIVIQLAVIKDIVLEAYNRPNEHVPFPVQSLNLEQLSKCSMVSAFVSSPFSAYDTAQYGKENLLFDTLSLQLSHLVLAPKSILAYGSSTSRQHYDLTRVYNFNRPFSLLYSRVPQHRHLTSSYAIENYSEGGLKFPSDCRLDIYTLLHIRNFWQRHLTHDSRFLGDCTYAAMAKDLLKLNMAPLGWDRPLSQPSSISTRWIGHYSCLHPWPKNSVDLEERQSCAQDWNRVNPMVLHWITSEANTDHCFWPPAFDSIPAFHDTMPYNAPGDRNSGLLFIRGSSNFLDLTTALKKPGGKLGHNDTATQYHPFTAARVRGFIHDIADPKSETADPHSSRRKFRRSARRKDQLIEKPPIPGYKRIVMIMYRPTTRYLIQVLEHAQGDFGGLFGTEVTTGFNTADIWNNNSTDLNSNPSSQDSFQGSANENTTNANHQQAGTGTPPSSSDMPISEEQLEEQLQTILKRRIESFTKAYNTLLDSSGLHSGLPPLFSPSHLMSLEESFSPSLHLTWDDGMSIDVAYAYEGVLIPGGKIALGRFHRCHGIDGLGDGREVDADGVGVEVRPVPKGDNESRSGRKRSMHEAPKDEFEIFINVEGTGEVVAAGTAGINGGCKGLDRGPFVFWTF